MRAHNCALSAAREQKYIISGELTLTMRLRIRGALALALMLSLWAAGCAGRRHSKPVALPTPPPRVAVGPFLLPPEVRVIAFHSLPAHFSTSIPPVWSENGLAVLLLQIVPNGAKIARFDGASFGHATSFNLGLEADGQSASSPFSLRAFAIDPEGANLAAIVDDSSDDSVKVFARSLEPGGAAKLVARFPGQVDDAALGWMSQSDLLMGLGATRATPSAAPSEEFAGLYRLSTTTRGDNSQFVIDCKHKINSGRFLLSAGRRRALVSSSDGEAVFLLDFDRFACRPVALPSLARIRVLGWGAQDSSILYSTVLGGRYAGVPAVFELALAKGQRRLIGAPMAGAVYTKRGTIAIPGSRSLNPIVYRLKPERLVPAQIGVVDESAFETTIFPLGLWTSAGLLAQAAIAYSPSTDTLAIEVPVPVEKAFNPAIVSFSVATKQLQSVAGARLDRMLLYNWAPAGGRLAICDCAGEPGSLLIVDLPLK